MRVLHVQDVYLDEIVIYEKLLQKIIPFNKVHYRLHWTFLSKAIIPDNTKLKTQEHMKKVYLKKDSHPVYVQETNRLRAKMKKNCN